MSLATAQAVFEETSLDLPDDLPFAEWAEIGTTLVRMQESVLWWLGSWWLFGESHYGEEATQEIPLGYSASTLKVAAWVADRVPPASRLTGVPWSHHLAVAKLPPPQQKRLLKKAKKEQWSRARLRVEAKASIGTGEDPEPDPPACEHNYVCTECGGVL